MVFRAYLRGTYLPGLSGNLTPAPSPGRSPPFRHPPTVLVQNYLSRFPTFPHTPTNKHAHYPRTRRFSDSRKLRPDIILARLSLVDLVTPRCRYMYMSVSYVTGYMEFYYEGISAKFVCICNTGSPLDFFF